ncbi:hypothetical protein G5714_014547 [Onychostoma macrolepis]|uniref:Uncharacterized protein n=1 Tax=Onychostoma macrolepis TaxID=369639 RepID=A0A7J6CDP9_9TELE|nr:hypothetical protein G5714_014547 [Onychostoma macrolepis]
MPDHPSPVPLEVALTVMANQDPRCHHIIELLGWTWFGPVGRGEEGQSCGAGRPRLRLASWLKTLVLPVYVYHLQC